MPARPRPWPGAGRPENALVDGRLGGTAERGDPDSWCPELWEWLAHAHHVTSMLDVGCGVGQAMQFFAEDLKASVLGVEASRVVIAKHVLPDLVVQHDLEDGPFLTDRTFDLVWCCELAEHVSSDYEGHVVRTLVEATGSVLAFCAAPPDCGGHNHVNCREAQYWASLIEAKGLRLDQAATDRGRELCVPNAWRSHANYFRRSGMVFVR
jgi:SAM-dependent methyltransferase